MYESGSLTAITPYARFTNYSTGNLIETLH
jgi:hypothetical protein